MQVLNPLLQFLLQAAVVQAAVIYDSNCTQTEQGGIQQCESAGEGFLFDQAKAQRCPQNANSSDSFTCDYWKCHITCSNPANAALTKSCTSDACPPVVVSAACWQRQQNLCNTGKPAGCDVDCSGASEIARRPPLLLAVAGLQIALRSRGFPSDI
eukprot:g23749.t1